MGICEQSGIRSSRTIMEPAARDGGRRGEERKAYENERARPAKDAAANFLMVDEGQRFSKIHGNRARGIVR